MFVDKDKFSVIVFFASLWLDLAIICYVKNFGIWQKKIPPLIAKGFRIANLRNHSIRTKRIKFSINFHNTIYIAMVILSSKRKG